MSIKYLEIQLQGLDSGKTRKVRWKLRKHPTAQRFIKALVKNCLNKDNILEKNYCFHGWLPPRGAESVNSRNINFLCEELNKAVDHVNLYCQKNEIDYRIEEFFSPDLLNQDLLNRIHHHFETWVGQVWDPGILNEQADEKTKLAVKQLNYLCHEMESLLKSQRANEEGNYYASLFVAFKDVVREELHIEDYDHFEFWLPFGSLRLHYAQLGKTHIEAFYDDDDIVDHSNISGLRYLSGEFDISFISNSKGKKAKEKEYLRFREWMLLKGFDPDDKKLAIGYIIVADLVREDFGNLSDFEILEELFNYNQIKKITLRNRWGWPVHKKDIDKTN
ncbi:MAG: hypothetical protein K9K67_13775 [Bacteriovoracaceae bacterium]|nr:hypothetical protein [Bacteriovoracaceae bacterium]